MYYQVGSCFDPPYSQQITLNSTQGGDSVYVQWLRIQWVLGLCGQCNCKFQNTWTHIHFVNVIHV